MKINRPSRKHLSSLSPILAVSIIIGVTWIGVHVIGSGHANTVRNNLVSHSSNQLVNNGKPFRFAGDNMYWLGLDDNIRDDSGNPTYPTQARIYDGFSEASALGYTVVRAHARYISWLFDLRYDISRSVQRSSACFNQLRNSASQKA